MGVGRRDAGHEARRASSPWGAVAAIGAVALILLLSPLMMGVASSPTASLTATVNPSVEGPAPGAASGTTPAAPVPAWVAGGASSSGKASPAARDAAVMAYDAKDRYVVLFGGYSSNVTWKFQGGLWSRLSTRTAPPVGPVMSMTYDAKNGYVVLLDGTQTWTFSSASWTELHPARSPPDRYAAAMTYDAKDGYVVLFGGVNSTGSYFGDTWKFVGGTWTELTTATHPSPRAFTSMVYDATDGYVVLFGGCHVATACTTGNFLADTWKFVGGSWSLLSPGAHPSARAGEMLTYDAADGYVLLFGGCASSNCSKPFGDTWTFVAGTWTHLTPSSHPAARVLGMIAYDVRSHEVVLFGGGGHLFHAFGDTWTFRAGAWTKA